MNAWALVGMAAALLSAVVAVAAAVVSRRAAIRTDEQLRRLEELHENPVRFRFTPAGEAAVGTEGERRLFAEALRDEPSRVSPQHPTRWDDPDHDVRADLDATIARGEEQAAAGLAYRREFYEQAAQVRVPSRRPETKVKITAACPVCPGTAGPFYEPAEYAAHIREHHPDLTTERPPDV